jgi:hypothetical protein
VVRADLDEPDLNPTMCPLNRAFGLSPDRFIFQIFIFF